MNRNQYMKELSYGIRKLPKEEYDRALAYFEEYFEEAGPENEGEAIERLGTPKEAAEELILEIAQRRLKEESGCGRRAARKRLSTCRIVLLSIAAFPVTLVGLVAALILLLFIGIGLLIGAVFLFMMVAMAFTAAGLGIWLLPFAAPSGLTALGVGLMMIGGGLLVLWLITTVFGLLGRLADHFMKKSLIRSKGRKRS